MQRFLGAKFGKTEIFWALAISIFIISEIFKVQWAQKSISSSEISVSHLKISVSNFKTSDSNFKISVSKSLFLYFSVWVFVFRFLIIFYYVAKSLFLGYKISVKLRVSVFRFWNLFFCQNTSQKSHFFRPISLLPLSQGHKLPYSQADFFILFYH